MIRGVLSMDGTLKAERLMLEMSKVFNLHESELGAEKRIKEDLVASSSQKFMLLAALEELTGKDIIYAQVNRCKTVGDILDLLGELEQANAE